MSDDRYELTTHDGKTVDKYTDWNLRQAEKKLGYPLTIVQGSYHKGVGASAGTHDGGGVVDLLPWDWQNKVHVLRELGFAAWHRPAIRGTWSEHIHAVLIGNTKASSAAKAQVLAYKNGRDGLRSNRPDYFWRPTVIKDAEYKPAAVTEKPVPVNLTGWKLTTYTEGPDGHAREVKQPELATYHSESFKPVQGGAFRFRVHKNGATTPHSTKPRTELRETKPSSWSTRKDEHILSETMAVTHLDKGASVVVGQIHDAADDVVMIRATGLGNGNFAVDAGLGLGKGNGNDWKPLAATYRLGVKFKVSTYADADRIAVRLNNDKAHQAKWPRVLRDKCYFKAGAYLQSGDWAELVLYALSHEHNPNT